MVTIRFHELSMRIVDLEEVGQDIDQEEEGFPVCELFARVGLHVYQSCVNIV